MNSSCDKFHDQMADYILGILSIEEINVINQHIDQCPGCRQYMQALENENRILMQFGKDLDTTMTARQDRAIEALSGSAPTSLREGISIWRTIMKNRITKYAATAVIILVMIIGITEHSKSPGGANVVFAAAMDSVREAGTFSCTQIFEAFYGDSEENGKYILKQKLMFKEPDWERREQLTSPWPKYIGEITITCYDTRQRLILRPVDKTATLQDVSSEYHIDEETDELKLTQLNTRLRDYMLDLSAGAIEDLGNVELDGQSIRLFQSRNDKRIATIWIDPATNYPVQIELKGTDQNSSPMMFTSIEIDTELDDDLFSLEPPEGYTLSVQESGPDYKNKMMTKVKYLGLWCVVYANDNEDQFPGEIADLVTLGVVTEEALNKALAAPDDTDGPPVIRYRKPNMVGKDWSKEVILYEMYDQWPEDGVVAGFADGHCERINDQNRFEELLE
ncbi:zf-HC2 domain-containing protein [Planctomycetota bacterium]